MNITLEELENYVNLSPENKAKFLELKSKNEQKEEFEKQRKNSPYIDWLQVNNSDDAYKAEDWLMKKSAVAYRLLRFLVKEMDNYNAIVCSFKVLEEALGYKRTALSMAVALLKEHKYIDVKKSGTSNVYLINKEIYWKSWGKNHKYAEFGAKIIIAESEQEPENKSNVKSERIRQLTVTEKNKKK